MKFSFLTAAMLAIVVPVSAQAATTAFDGTCTASATTTHAACSTSTTGSYGNSATIASTTDATLKVLVTAWQGNQSTNAITSAFLGAYSGGFGVTGINDQSGNNNLHQIDNVNGYTDFVMLQFNRAVHLEGIGVNFFGINGVYDSDAGFFNAGVIPITPATWNNTINLASGAYVYDASVWSNTTSSPDNASGQGSASRTNAAAGFSQVWLVGASSLTTDRDDGFKLSSITVTQIPAVPEPATWGMLIIGFGAIGATLRRRRVAGSLAAA